MRRRVFAFLMAFVMLCSAVPTQAFAVGGTAMRGVGKGGSLLSQLTTEITDAADSTEAAQTTDEVSEPAQPSAEQSEAATDAVEEVIVEGDVSDEAESAVTYAMSQGLPIHFFVASPEEASNPEGQYANFKESLWGKQNGADGYAYANAGVEDDSVIHSQQGIRTANDESLITTHVYSWPAGTDAESFKEFDTLTIPRDGTYSYADGWRIQWVTICWRQRSGNNYGTWCNCSVSYEHIHIDGILTKMVEPGEMKLYKQLSQASATEQEFTFTLQRLQQNADYSLPSQEAVDSSFAPLTLTATIPQGSTDRIEIQGTDGVEIGFGYYKLTENKTNGEWVQSGIDVGNGLAKTSGSIYIHVNTDGSVEYSTQYRTGYRVSTNGATVINEPIPQMDIQVRKEWNDQNNQDGIRPASIEIHLLQNGSHYGTPVTLDQSNDWTATWTVPQLDVNGNAITYNVEETVPDGYTCVVSGNATDGFVVTNSHTPDTVVVNVQKRWEDDNDRDGIRPDSVTVQLVKNGTPVEGSEITLVEEYTWTGSWSGLEKNQPKTDPNAATVENVYTVQEINTADGYESSVEDMDGINLIEVVNTHVIDTIDIPVEKIWDDADDQDNIRPDSVTVTLFANGESTGKTLTLTAENEWKGAFQDVLKNENGVAINYTLEENEVSGYTVDIVGNATDGFTVTNTHTVETTSVSFNKVWADNDNQDGIRPTSVTITLYADGTAIDTMTVTSADNWAGTFENLPKYKEGAQGVEIVYTVGEAEGDVPDGYTATVSGTTITNTHVPETANLNVLKVWGDNNNNDGKRPYAVVITLHANGAPTEYTLTLSAENDWKGTWPDMPRFQNGQRISYTTVETGALMTEEDYEAYLDGDTSKLNTNIKDTGYTVTHSYGTDENGEPLATVTNSYTPLTTFLNVQKSWADNDDQDGIRPDTITVTLYRKVGDGEWESTGKTKTMTAENGWTDVTFTGLPMYENGKAISYNVVETAIDGYTAAYNYDPATGIAVITNTHIPEKTSVSVTKVWDDHDDQDGIRPESDLTVELFADGETTGKTAELIYADGKWSTATFTGLDKYTGGREIAYTVEEAPVDGYTASYEETVATQADGTSVTNIVVTNTHAVEKTEISVTKNWNDADNQDGIRPESITVTVYQGETEVASQTLTATNGWEYTFTGLDKYENGTLIDYTVEETAITGYTGEVVENADGSVTITNTHVPETTYVTATKIWDDADNQDGKRPASIELHLLASGDHVGDPKTVTPDADGNWPTVTWDNLPKYSGGTEIVYTVTESAVAGYDVEYSEQVVTDDAGNSYVAAVITNSYTPAKTSVNVTKQWHDADNQDGKRPDSITVELYADNVATGKTLTLSASGGWIGSFNDLDLKKNGVDIQYSVVETTDVDGYDVSYGEGDVGELVVINTHTTEVTDVSISKVWSDASNQDGKRPYAVAVELYANGEATGNIYVFAGTGNTWSYTVEDLPKYSSGTEVRYTIEEYGYIMTEADYEAYMDGDASKLTSGVPEGYSAAASGTTVTNSYTPETVSVPVTKVWEDANNQDGIRPAEITVTLYADGVAVQTLSLRETTNWTDSFDNLPKYSDGEEIVYTVEESNVPDGYTSSVEGNVITNTHIPATANLNVNKSWSDNDNQDGKRPYAIQVTLYANGTAIDTLVLGDGTTLDDSGSWENMPQYQNGEHISYTIQETGYYATKADYDAEILTSITSSGYTPETEYVTTDPQNPVANITNTYDPESISVNIQKVWDDADNQDGIRPDEITVTLYADDVSTGKTAVMNPANEWDVDFTDLPKYKDGKEIVYTVVENAVEGYTTSYSEIDGNGVIVVTNTHEPATIQVSVNKVWNDHNNQDGKRPASVTVTLYAGGTATDKTLTLSASNNWEGTFENLAKYYHGEEIRYSVVEDAVAGYTIGYGRNPEGTELTVTNSHDPEQIEIPVTKVWDDENNQDGIRPKSITVTVSKGETVVAAHNLTAEGNWHYTFTGLDKYEDGKLVDYTVEETAITGYTGAVVENADGSVTITNTHEPETVKVTATKIWNDNNNQDGKRPASITLHLLASGNHTSEEGVTVKPDANGNWTYEWKDLPKYSGGTLIIYTVTESAIVDAEGKTIYTVSYDNVQVEDGVNATITNSYDPAHTAVTVEKLWRDNYDQDGIRPDSITVELYANGDATGKTLELTAAGGWIGTFSGLDLMKDGVEIEYTVVEVTTVGGYDVDYGEDTVTGDLEVINTHEPATTQVSVTKVWNDNNDQDGKRPESITVTLLANNAPTGTVAVLSERADGTWTTATFKNLPKYQGGKEIVYTVSETPVDGYTTSVSAADDNGVITVTNTYTPEKVSIPVTKIWNDKNNQDGIRPEKITVTVYKGDTVVATDELTAENNWKLTFTGLDKYENGTLIDYTVEETAITGYTGVIVEKDDGTVEITNTHIPETADLKVTKAWNDNDNQDGKRPYAVQITLFANGTATDKTLILGNGLNTLAVSGTWEDMPRYHNGQRISYTTVETGYYLTEADYKAEKLTSGTVPGYQVTHDYDYAKAEATVTNTYAPETTFLRVYKNWNDADNQDGIRPAAITVTLYADGVSTGQTKTMNAANDWLDITFTNLPKYNDGKEIVYSVRETAVEGYTTEYEYDSANGIAVITNTHTPEKTSVTVTKVWNDNNDQDGIRPDSITVALLANNAPTGTVAVLRERADGTWSTATFRNLPKYQDGREIVYTVSETSVDGYTASVSAIDGNGMITVTNTHTPEKISVPVEKTWVDNNDQDGIRPDSITVTIYKGETVVATHELTAANNWKYTFTDLAKYEDGEVIDYTVRETAITGYTDKIVENSDGSVSIINTHVPETTYVVATKVWEDGNDQDGKRPASITLHLLANGEHTGQKQVLTANDEGEWPVIIWENLPKYAGGLEINYTVMEESVEGYSVEYSEVFKTDSEGNRYIDAVITNTYNPEKTSVIVEKLWRDNYNQDGKRPDSITVTLYADGVSTGKTLVLSASTNWIGTFRNLDLMKDGVKIVYSVVESAVTGYDVAYDKDDYTGNLEVINSYNPESTGAIVTKVWNDANDQDGIRPYAVVMALYANGQPVGRVITLSSENSWTGVLENLDKYANGVEIEYSFVETGYYMTEGGELISGVPTGYTASYGRDGNSVIVSNTHVPETISVPVTKIWNDNGNQDGIRPDSITVTLYADGEAVATKELRASTNWTGTFTNLPKYSDGKEITYTVGELEVPGYTSSVEGNVITNTHIPETANLNVVKVWGDNNNQDGKRPYAVVITLYVNGQATEYTATLSPDNGWTDAWEDMPRYHNGQRISYTVVETGYYQTAEDLANGNLTSGVPSGYTVTHSYDTSDSQNPVATVINSYTPMSTSLNVQKVWDDDDNRDGVRPAEITVTLLQKIGDGEWTATDKTTVLNPANEWDATFVGLPMYQNGQKITYNVVESAVEGYGEPVYSYNEDIGVITITNTHVAERTALSVKKVWNDNENQDGIRPAGVIVQMYANGQPAPDQSGNYVYATLSAENDWSYTWENLYSFYHGSEIRYAVVEVGYIDAEGETHEGVPTGYTAAYGRNDNMAGTVTITNTHKPAEVSIPVYKTWDDNNNQDGKRPEKIEVMLTANGVATDKTLTLTAADNWHGAFSGLPMYADGKLIEYAATEAAIVGYNDDKAISVKVVDGVISITNTHEIEKTELTAIKVWDDNNDQDGERPDTITLHLLADGVNMGDAYKVTIDAEDGWTYTWTDLDKYAAGREIRYTVYEEPVLLKSVQADAESAEGSAARVADRYVATYVRNPEKPTEITITNAYTPKTTVITAMKVWDDGDDRDGLRPDSITVTLYQDGVAVEDYKDSQGNIVPGTMILSEETEWIANWIDLPEYRDQGEKIIYTVKESTELTGYVSEVRQETEFAPGLFIITNKHDPEVTGVTVTKVWNDEDNIEGLRLSGIIVQLRANASPIDGAVVTLSEGNLWTYTWTNVGGQPLYVNAQGEVITYDVVEIGYVDAEGNEHILEEGEKLPNSYTPSYEQDGYSVTITNTRAAEKTEIETQKKWIDEDNNDGIRPYAVELTLLKDNAVVDKEILTEANGWTTSWNNLYVYAAGEAIEYKVVETGYIATADDYEAYLEGDADKLIPGVPEGYTSSDGTLANSYVVTNTHEIDIWKTQITKIWKDNNDGSKRRPDSIDVQLYKNGEAYGDAIELNEENDWEVTVELPVFEDGKKITWTVEEVKVPTYYTVSYNQDTLTITNTIKTDGSPQTGDQSNIWMWSGLLGVSGIGAVLLLLFGKKKKVGKYAR